MADYDERSAEDLTEEPSPYKLEEMRSKGQVAQSKELTSTVVFIGALSVLYYSGKNFAADFTGFMKDLFQTQLARQVEFRDAASFAAITGQMVKLVGSSMLPFFIVLVVLGIVASIAQTRGFIFSTHSIEPDFSKVNPVSGFQRVFSFQGIQEGLKSLVKFVAVAACVYFVIKKEIFSLPEMVGENSNQLIAHIGSLIIKICLVVAMVMLFVSGLDFVLQWWNMRKKAMMTKVEAKQEHKERDGDPQIKARIRSMQREMARKRMMKNIHKADVIITNPTHIAIAIIYEKDMMAPKVIAKGADFLAERIRNMAKQHSIPIVENKVLARTLYKHVKVGQMIPRSLYQAVAEVLSYVYKIKPKDIFINRDHDL